MEWIKCSDRMPLTGTKVLLQNPAWDGCDEIEIGILGDGKWWVGDCDSLRLESVTHWAPLPEPPVA